MQLLLPLVLSSVLVAAAPYPRPAVETAVVTVYQYVDASEVAPTPAPEPKPSEPAYTPAPASTSASTDNTQTAKVTVSNKQTTTDSDRMTEAAVDAIYKTCWNGQLQWPLGDTPAPCLDKPASQLSLFARPDATANTLTVKNYCGYDIYYNHFGGSGLLGSGKIAAGKDYTSPLSGSVFKASKTSDMARDILVEYANVNGMVYYDMSMITCLGTANGLPNSDTSACAGHDGGLQLGNPSGMSFQCAAGSWCDDQAYLYQENLCKKQNPVSACAASHGLTMEFCAGKK